MSLRRTVQNRAGDLAAATARHVAEELAKPPKRAYWGAYVVTLAVLRGKGVGPLPAMLIAALAAEGASMAWQTMDDVHTLAEARREASGAVPAD